MASVEQEIPEAADPAGSISSIAYSTDLGSMISGTVENALESSALLKAHAGKVNLLFTSPPFPLNRKKRYGNRNGNDYLEWMAELAPKLADMLGPNGSIVIEIGNAWEAGRPIMSTLPLETLLRFLTDGKLNLCQQFICHNPARLPTPAQWVNVKRVRVKDSYTHVWWMSRSDNPKANNRQILIPYSNEMKKLLKTQTYNAGTRPSGHNIGATSFLTDNGGAIPSNVLQFSNTEPSSEYTKACDEIGLVPHPARMPAGLIEFFVNFLTEPGDLVFDPFAGSNSTGAVAESLGRRWLSVEPDADYIRGSKGRFPGLIKEGQRVQSG